MDQDRTLRAAKDLAPEFFAHVGRDTPRRWKHSSEGEPEAKCGRAPSWSDAQLTVLSEMASAVIGEVPVSASVLRGVFNKHLASEGMPLIKSNAWVRQFLGARGHSWRRYTRSGLGKHSEWQKGDLQQSVAQEIRYVQRLH